MSVRCLTERKEHKRKEGKRKVEIITREPTNILTTCTGHIKLIHACLSLSL